ncbi:probable ATP-dependent RNA helicase DHX58 isoform X2 [Dunckerocampus dactyliophorus]|uniref:probable ATP-dependent RNA helicase DHX58 isoform X2 n=1 Tax=Dunckerocampus dactyliophorus TaxID=161453 RepID=UPI0024058F1D|nr:probable ATP-dependent RNA helicase DHX58 isoform X2 [Dunckerocampus dactyliophorus]
MSDFGLFEYQEEVVQRALRGENIIIWLPTGSGKTRAAVYVAKKHLQRRQQGKVVVLVNMLHLVDQHFSTEFVPGLAPPYKVVAVSGYSDEKDFFGKLLRDSDVVICTAQIFHNALVSTEEAKHVELSEISLLVVDECHHTHKNMVYNKIMREYLHQKMLNGATLPQILGLTASPGTGRAKCLDRAVLHVLQLCASLDSVIVTTNKSTQELNMRVPRPVKIFDIVERRPQDPFGDQLKCIMQQIHDFMKPPEDFTLRECGTQEYEADMVTLEKRGVQEYNRVLQQCAIHLRKYNDALLINDTLRMKDALRFLKDFYKLRMTTLIDSTDLFLVQLFQENRQQLKTLARDPRYENPKMAQLEATLLRILRPSVESRGILFSKTRRSTSCLMDWVLRNASLQEAGIKPAILIGTTSMTQHEQRSTIQKFRQGAVNLLIATSVAEEGLDIPECNLVVRYGLLTNEIAQQQASGRARAKDSQYSLVAQRGGREERREHVNMYLQELTAKAVAAVHQMTPSQFSEKIAELQREAVCQGRNAESEKKKKNGRYSASSVQLLCQHCLTPVARGSDFQLVENMHYVNVNPDFKLWSQGEVQHRRTGAAREDLRRLGARLRDHVQQWQLQQGVGVRDKVQEGGPAAQRGRRKLRPGDARRQDDGEEVEGRSFHRGGVQLH